MWAACRVQVAGQVYVAMPRVRRRLRATCGLQFHVYVRKSDCALHLISGVGPVEKRPPQRRIEEDAHVRERPRARRRDCRLGVVRPGGKSRVIVVERARPRVEAVPARVRV